MLSWSSAKPVASRRTCTEFNLDRVDLSFHSSFDNTPPFEVKFFFTRTPLKLMHRALEDTRDRIPFIYSTARQTPLVSSQSHVFTALGELNEEQRHFVSAVVQARKVTQIELSLEEKLLAEKLSARHNGCSRAAIGGVRNQDSLPPDGRHCCHKDLGNRANVQRPLWRVGWWYIFCQDP